MQKEIFFEHNYTLNKENVAKAILQLHKDKNRVKNIVHICILALISVFFIIDLIMNFNTMSLMLLVMCALIFYTLFFGQNDKAKRLSERFGEGKNYTVRLCPDSVSFISEQSEVEIEFDKVFMATENENFYYFESQKRMYPVPKENIEDEKIKEISSFLEKNLQKRYKNYCKN